MTDRPQPALGILMLDTRFPRIPGDVGNPATWDFPVRYRVIEGATPEAIVQKDQGPFLQAFLEAGHALVDEGCRGIATTCGFLSPMRRQLAAALGVPVAASALEQGPQIMAALPPDKRIGVLTISKASLGPRHLNAAGLAEDTPVEGLDGSSFARAILENLTDLEVRDARREMVVAARRLVTAHPDIGAIILECTNMPPYAAAVAAEIDRPVFSIHSYLTWFHTALAPPSFG